MSSFPFKQWRWEALDQYRACLIAWNASDWISMLLNTSGHFWIHTHDCKSSLSNTVHSVLNTIMMPLLVLSSLSKQQKYNWINNFHPKNKNVWMLKNLSIQNPVVTNYNSMPEVQDVSCLSVWVTSQETFSNVFFQYVLELLQKMC